MTFTKTTAAAAALLAAAALAAPLSSANAHGKKHFHSHHHGLFVIGTPGPSCGHWLWKYKKTGKQKFLNRYYACIL
jgi:Spy/CpxP family protein refolding chaperone